MMVAASSRARCARARPGASARRGARGIRPFRGARAGAPRPPAQPAAVPPPPSNPDPHGGHVDPRRALHRRCLAAAPGRRLGLRLPLGCSALLGGGTSVLGGRLAPQALHPGRRRAPWFPGDRRARGSRVGRGGGGTSPSAAPPRAAPASWARSRLEPRGLGVGLGRFLPTQPPASLAAVGLPVPVLVLVVVAVVVGRQPGLRR